MRVIFMGTPGFAVPTLEKLISSQHEVVAVYTNAPKPAGRGYNEVKSRPHQIAEAHGIPVYTPKNFRSPADVEQFKSLTADVAVVAAYGLLLPETILRGTRYGCINIHPSNLPRWRGAAPLHHTILAGDTSTEVCIMHMDEGLDTGDVYMRQFLDVPASMTTNELHDITSEMGAGMLLKVLQSIEQETAVRIPQVNDGMTYAHKLTREHERIDWKRSAFEIYCQIRAFSPKPCAYFTYNNEIIKIIAAEYDNSDSGHEAGSVIGDRLEIACGQGVLRPTILQREGRKPMDIDSLLRGFNIAKNMVLIS